MYQLSVETEFSAAHSLTGYEGPCARTHGHNYRVIIEVAGDALDRCGMLLDFREIRRICDSFVSELDHQHLNQIPAFAGINPTAENIARHIFLHIASAMRETAAHREREVRPVRVTVYESARSGASYSE
jgi:6-pyruvoyltetrahydropterin/6-carboxytetrahydropterin synthase